MEYNTNIWAGVSMPTQGYTQTTYYLDSNGQPVCETVMCTADERCTYHPVLKRERCVMKNNKGPLTLSEIEMLIV
ncbi:hypothetical protein FF38_12192 [Lucilia cuprina]|uniref:Uncharacterized protein n=1 Tax=Lucilia cuprina TaxID=7375 RepID=A0A0L0BTH3_LUCCU|nr:hypothetical protein FF38_12192 [Lucilia cuprina]